MRKPTRSLLNCAFWLAAALMAAQLANAQISEPPQNPSRSRTPDLEIRESKPPVYYMRNDKGNLVLVPNFSFELFDKLYKQMLGQGTPTSPQTSFSGVIQIDGEQQGEAVDLNVTMTVRMNPIREDSTLAPMANPVEGSGTVEPLVDVRAVRVPLRFGQATLLQVPDYVGPGRADILFETENNGYALWIYGPPRSEHTVKLKFSASIQRVGIENRIAVSVPPTPTKFDLRVKSDRAVAQSISGNTSLKQTERKTGQGTTFTFVGASGDFQLAWRDSLEPPVRTRQVLDATGSIQVVVDSRSRIRADARFRVVAHGHLVQEFRLQLPPGFRLSESQAPSSEFQISPIGNSLASSGPSRQSVMIRLTRETSNSPEILVQSEWQGTSDEMPVDVAGFEVEGAVRQVGVIELGVNANLNVRWNEGTTIRRVDSLPEASRQNRVIARFEYDSQPASLKLAMSPNVMRVSVEPIHLIDIQPNRVELRSVFRYAVGGGKLERVDFLRRDWKIVRVLPTTLLPPDPILLTDEVIGLPLAIDLQGNLDVELISIREFDPNSTTFSLDEFPAPTNAQASKAHLQVAPASFVIAVADNVDAELINEQLRGLVSEPIPPKVTLPVRQLGLQFFRQQPDAESPRVSFRWKLKSRETLIDTQHQILVADGPQVISTRLQVQVSHDPTDSITVQGPRHVFESGSFRALVEGRVAPVSLQPYDDELSGKPSPTSRAKIQLPEKRLGKFDLVLEYPAPLWTMPASQFKQEQVSLVTPLVDSQTTIRTSQLQLTSSSPLRTSLADEQWRPQNSEGTSSSDGQSVRYQSQGNPDTVTLEVRTGNPGRTGTVVLRAWVQSWLSDSDRRDRAVFYLTTNERRLRIHIPEAVRNAGLEVLVDNNRVSNGILASSEMQIELAPSEHRTSHVVEVWCWLPRGSRRWGQQSLEMIRLLGAERVDRLHWEVSLPPGEHLLAGVAGLVPEYTWRWRNAIWQRVPHFSQRDLEIWSGGTPSRPIPENTNRYVFSGLSEPNFVTILSCSRSTLVTFSAGPLFLLGLIAFMRGWWNRPIFPMSVGLVLILISLIEPDIGVLFGQSAVVGLIALCMTRLWRGKVGLDAKRNRSQTASPFGPESRSAEIHSGQSKAGSSVHRSTMQLSTPPQTAPPQAVP